MTLGVDAGQCVVVMRVGVVGLALIDLLGDLLGCLVCCCLVVMHVCFISNILFGTLKKHWECRYYYYVDSNVLFLFVL